MEIISDNGQQFVSKYTTEYCQSIGIQNRFASVEHPQTNGQVESANKAVIMGMKRRLEDAKGRWPEELPAVLWSYNTTAHTSMGETPFKLTYGADVVLPIEIENLSWRVENFDLKQNSANMVVQLDLLPEVREVARIKNEAIKQIAARHYNSKLVSRAMKAGDLVLKKKTSKTDENKLSPNWEGPYRVRKSLGNGGYHLEELSGKRIPRSWNATHLRPYYS